MKDQSPDVGKNGDIAELVSALRELVDYYERLSHWRHAERSRTAFDRAVEVLNKYEVPE